MYRSEFTNPPPQGHTVWPEETSEKPSTFLQVLTEELAFVGLEYWLPLLILHQGTFDNV